MVIAIEPFDKFPLTQEGRLKLEWDAFIQNLAAFPRSYTTAGLPSSAIAGTIAFASDGRKPLESHGSGTGMLVFYDGSNWISVSSGTTITS